MAANSLAKKIRRRIIEASFRAGACHIGSALSCVEILIEIFNRMEEGDYFIFSKASGVAAYYAMLVERGVIPEYKLVYYLKNYPLPSKEVPGVIWSGGSLGHGLPAACGLALADKNRKVYVLISDAELQEGTTWESLLFKNHHELHNLIIYCDWNDCQACGRTHETLGIPIETISEMGIRVVKTIKGQGISFCEDNNEWHYRNLNEAEYKQALKELE